jgi:hypothetical protein
MGGATILCGAFEGEDKAGSPVVSVLDEAYALAFGTARRSRFARRVARWLGKTTPLDRENVELAILEIMYDEEGKFSSQVADLLLPHLRSYQDRLLKQHAVPNDINAIAALLVPSTAAKYGKKFDPGWHLYCLHDLVLACEKSVETGEPVQVIWS